MGIFSRTLGFFVVIRRGSRCRPVVGTKNLFFTFPGKACILQRPNLYCQPFRLGIEILSRARRVRTAHTHTHKRNARALA